MEIALNILAQPVNLALFILRKLQTTSAIVNDGFMGRRAIEAAVVGELVCWLVLAVLVAAGIFLALKFVLEGASSGTGAANELFPALGSVLWRLMVGLVIYAVLSILLYAFVNLAHLVSNEMDYAPPAK
jgi:hypothetical protein